MAGTSHLLSEKSALEKENGAQSTMALRRPPELAVGLLTGGHDKPYAFGLAMALASKDVALDVIGGDAVDSPWRTRNIASYFNTIGGVAHIED